MEINVWSQRLSELSGIDLEEARKIAKDKIQYHASRIQSLREKQYRIYNSARAELISKLEGINPLKEIFDERHAKNILNAAKRHRTTNYDKMLGKAKRMAKNGNIQWTHVREYARQNIKTKKTKPAIK